MDETWIEKCDRLKAKWPVYIPDQHLSDETGINIYQVLESVNDHLHDDMLVVTDAGSPSYTCPTNLKASIPNQFIFNPSQADMGWAIPACVGVALAAPHQQILVIVGDGSFYSNLQELAVIRHHSLPVSVFVLNNNGYLSIRNTQKKYHGNRVWGVDENSGLTFPALQSVAHAFQFEYHRIENTKELNEHCHQLMRVKDPTIVEIICQQDQEILPAQSFRTNGNGTRIQAPLHDMYPFLTTEELAREWPKY